MSVNMDAFIEEVRVRPAIYDITLPEYSDRSFKRSLWDQICKKFTVNWEDLTEESRDVIGREMKNRWKSIRDAFVREVRYIKEAMKNGEPLVKKRKYIYYDQLAFLLPTVGVRGMKNQNIWSSVEDGYDLKGEGNREDYEFLWPDFYQEEDADDKKRGRRIRGRRKYENLAKDNARRPGRPMKISPELQAEDPDEDPEDLDKKPQDPDRKPQDLSEPQGNLQIIEDTEEEQLEVNPAIEDIVPDHHISESVNMYDSYDCRNPDHDYMYLMSLLPSLRKLGEEKKSIIKIEISSLIHEALYGSTGKSIKFRL